MRYYSLRMNLEDVIKDRETEQTILENIRRCSKLVGMFFKVVFWHENLTQKECKDFIKRNEKLLFEVNTKITKKFDRTWFLIDSTGEDESKYSFKYTGEILQGIAKYIELILKVRKNDYDDNRR